MSSILLEHVLNWLQLLLTLCITIVGIGRVSFKIVALDSSKQGDDYLP